jgi:protein SCO1
MNKTLLFILFLLAACQAAPEAPPLAGAKLGGAFHLTNQDSKQVTEQDYRGKYTLIYFGYTYCPDACPNDMQKLMAGFKLLEKDAPQLAAKIQPLFIGTDPKRDTPARLKLWTQAFSDKLIGLTGSLDELKRVEAEYGAVVEIGKPAPHAAPDTYLVNHSRTALLFDPQGAPLIIISSETTPAQIVSELRQWVK